MANAIRIIVTTLASIAGLVVLFAIKRGVEWELRDWSVPSLALLCAFTVVPAVAYLV